MTVEDFALSITDKLPYEPNEQQLKLIGALARFCSSSAPPNSVFVLNGYAGTGKTSVTAALVNALADIGMRSVLLAPTGRAAKVSSRFSGRKAFTIHRKIYHAPAPGESFSQLTPINNPHTDTIFIVDEASMIARGGESGSLLEDLVEYVYSAEGCRMILVGDTAQLPPVGSSESPAMQPEVLRSLGLKVTRVVMTRTVRQASDSGILYNATAVRRRMALTPLTAPELTVSPFDDVETADPTDLGDIIASAYARDGVDETVIVTRSNRRAVDFNLAIRSQVLDREEELARDELLLVARNNYFWNDDRRSIDFIANGDVARVVRIYGTETRYGLRFADVALSLPDRDTEFDAKIILDSLTSDTPALETSKQQILFEETLRQSPGGSMRILKTDPWFNALQVKYAYAVTCHKAQGGQWRNVLVDMGYIPPEAYAELDLHRWLYTALTRATSRLWFINPSVIVN